MNLARVEYYLSDFLSIIETRHREDGRVVTDEIILDKAVSVTYGKVILPENLYVIGTVNMDETTFPFSKRFLIVRTLSNFLMWTLFLIFLNR